MAEMTLEEISEKMRDIDFAVLSTWDGFDESELRLDSKEPAEVGSGR